ncbi:MAG: aspartate aminotransferase family protein [Chitinispirillaceae bacterium]|nr:aspartate aminotransferase family protein [Chitinispirillaceae bacterium]
MNTKKFDTVFVPTYAREGAPFTHGKGSYLFDSTGAAYLDFGSGIAVNALGHAHPALQKALRTQGNALIHASNLYFTQPQIDLAKLLVKHSFADRVFFCNSGTEANEAAIKFARKWARTISPEKYHILSFTDGFHGRTYGALSATAQEKFHAGFDPILNGFHYAPFNDMKAVRKLLRQYKFAAIFVEPLQGEGGINQATGEFLRFLRDIATKHKCVLVFDEVQCGMGRTGTLWNYQQHKVIPDIMTLAKPLGGGLPLGAVVTRDEIALCIKPGDHGTTFGGNPVACALGIATLSTVADRKFLADIRKKSTLLIEKLTALKPKFPAIEQVLGSGLLVGVRMKDDPSSIIAACRKNGLLLIKAGHNTVRFIPPLTVKTAEIGRAVAIFKKVLITIFQ